MDFQLTTDDVQTSDQRGRLKNSDFISWSVLQVVLQCEKDLRVEQKTTFRIKTNN